MRLAKATKFGGILGIIFGEVGSFIATGEAGTVMNNIIQIVSVSVETIGILSVTYHAIKDHIDEKRPV